MRMISPGQKKIIWTIVRKNNIDVEGFRDWLQRDFDTRSTRKLTFSQANEVIRSLRVFIVDEHKRHLITWGITDKQVWKAQSLADNLGWDDPKRLNGLIKKMFEGKFNIAQLNKTEGSKLIVALEKMLDDVKRGEKVYA